MNHHPLNSTRSHMGSLFIGIPAKEIVGWYGMLNRLGEIHEHMFIVDL